jgi:hypothetical protein
VDSCEVNTLELAADNATFNNITVNNIVELNRQYASYFTQITGVVDTVAVPPQPFPGNSIVAGATTATPFFSTASATSDFSLSGNNHIINIGADGTYDVSLDISLTGTVTNPPVTNAFHLVGLSFSPGGPPVFSMLTSLNIGTVTDVLPFDPGNAGQSRTESASVSSILPLSAGDQLVVFITHVANDQNSAITYMYNVHVTLKRMD